MNLRMLLCGAIGGVLVTLALTLPLYFMLPSAYAADWPAAGLTLGTVGYALAALLACGTGHVAARWSWASQRREGWRAGLLAGGLTAFIAFPLVGAPAAGVAGAGPVFLHDADSNLTEAELLNSTVRVVWYTYLTFPGMLFGGAAFGGIGGWHTERCGKSVLGSPPHPFPDTSGQAALLLWIVTGIVAFLVLHICSPTARTVIAASAETELDTLLPVQGVLNWPVGMSLTALVALTWWIGRWSAVPGEEGVSRLVHLAAVALILVPLFGISVLAIRTPALQTNVVFWLGSVVWFLVTLYWIYWLGERAHSAATPLPGELALNGLLLAMLTPGLVMLTGVSCVISVLLGIVPFLRTQDGGEGPPTVRAAIEAVFAYHVLSSLVCAIVTAGSFIIMTGSGYWWPGQRKKPADALSLELK